MAVACSQPSLLAEFKSLKDELGNQHRFRCRANNKIKWASEPVGERCANFTSAANTIELRNLLGKIIVAISSGQTDIKKEIKAIASLVMCQGQHQSKAKAQKKRWVGMIEKPDGPETRDASQVTTDTVGSSLVEPNVVQKPVDPIAQAWKDSNDPHLGPADALFSRRSSAASVYQSAEEDFKNSGYKSDDGDDKVKVEDALPADIHAPPPQIEDEYTADDPFTTPKKPQPPVKSEFSDDDPFTTPNKPLRQFFVDSAISMGFTSPQESFDTLDAELAPPSSPLDKVSKNRAQRGKREDTRPDATPIQTGHRKLEEKTKPEVTSVQPVHRELGEAPVEEVEFTGHESTFRSYRQPSVEMIKYIKQKLGALNMVDGYLYVFKISGPNYYKIGYANKRPKFTMEGSFEERMKELRKDWPDLVVVFQCRLPHAQRTEQIIHKHLDKRRLTETACKRTTNTNGSDCEHHDHSEWFDVPLNEIFTVASAWCHWIRSDPYPLVGKERFLSQDWIAKLDAFDCSNDLGLEPGYYWLEWLYLHTPESRSLKGLDVMELIKFQRELERKRKEQENEHGDTEKPTRLPIVNNDKTSIVETSEIVPKVFSPLKSNSTWNHVNNYEIEKDSKTKLLRKIFHKLEGLKR